MPKHSQRIRLWRASDHAQTFFSMVSTLREQQSTAAEKRLLATFTSGRQNNLSYGVAIRRADGTLALIRIARGEPRVTFDPKAHIDRYADQLQEDFKRTSINRSVHGGDSGDFWNSGRPFHTTDRPSFLFGEAMPE